MIGAFLGGLLANLLIPDANFGLIGSIIVAIIGACLFIWLLRLVTRGRTL
ncbi:MAG: GlsB/YeaQ/YmgE family stress response membrane protein [Ktedonobacteraceae bacterium]